MELMETNPEIIEGLQKLLSNTYSLQAQTQVAHWNVRGHAFFSLHKAFGKQYDELAGQVDDIAEKIRALGSLTSGGLSYFSQTTDLQELSKDVDAESMVIHLLTQRFVIVSQAHELRELCGKNDDLETQDFVMGIIQSHQKTCWMLSAFLEDS